jgi:hypothetical protein
MMKMSEQNSTLTDKKSSGKASNELTKLIYVLSSSSSPVLPDGKGGFTLCPELLTEEEAIRYLRLDTIDIDDPVATLRRYRDRNLLCGTQVSKKIFYRRVELDAFLMRLTDGNPR